jgi:DNA polymerase V
LICVFIQDKGNKKQKQGAPPMSVTSKKPSSKPTSGWGGARAGAGRKKKDAEPQVSVPQEMVGKVIDYVESKGFSFPFFSGTVQAGFAATAGDDHIDRHLSPDDLVLNPAGTFWTTAAGKSMEPRIYDGDLLMCDRTVRPISGDIVVAVVDGEQTVKVYQQKDRGIWLLPLNPTFQPLRVRDEHQLYIQGVVINTIHTTHPRFLVYR